jgi:two-component system LytT family sensor kinase
MLITGLLWSPVPIWAILLHTALTGSPLSASAVLLIPPLILLLGIAISVWYICRWLPFDKENLFIFATRHALTMILILTVWTGISTGYAGLLSDNFPLGHWDQMLAGSLPLLAGTGIFTYLLSILIYYLIIANERIRNAERDLYQKQIESSRSELDALKTTVHPHFLFNTLNLISPLIKKSPDKASELISYLSEFLLYSFEHSIRKDSCLSDEIEHIRNYLSVEKFRLGDRLSTRYEIAEDTRDIVMPPLILLPVIENSIKHGISQMLEGGTIRIGAVMQGKHLVISVTNPFEPNAGKPRGSGHGLANLKKRIALYFNGEGGVLTDIKNGEFNVRIFIPVPGREK